jgi:hypothetical protein
MPDFLHHTYDLNQPEMASAFDQVSFWSARFGLFLFKYLELRPNLERLHMDEAHRGTKESISGMLKATGFRIVNAAEDSFQLRYLDGSALFNHLLTQLGFLDGWRRVVDPEDEEHVFALLEHKLNQIASAHGELRMTVPMLYLEGEKPA